jgi:ribonuclease HI
MTAIVEGLRQSPPAKSVTVCTDAQFIAEAMSTGAADVWRKSNWRRPSGRGEIKNPSQWAAILDAVVGKDAAISWLHGHVAGWDWEEARSLAKQKARVLATWPHQL